MMNFMIPTKGFDDVIDITDWVEREVDLLTSRIKSVNGAVLIFMPHQTCGLTLLENEEGLKKDFKKFLERIAPLKEDYHHQDKFGGGNARAHILAAMIGPDLTIPLGNGKMMLGEWQQIVLVDFDNRPRERRVIVKILKSSV